MPQAEAQAYTVGQSVNKLRLWRCTLHTVVVVAPTHNCKTNERANKWEVQPSRSSWSWRWPTVSLAKDQATKEGASWWRVGLQLQRCGGGAGVVVVRGWCWHWRFVGFSSLWSATQPAQPTRRVVHLRAKCVCALMTPSCKCACVCGNIICSYWSRNANPPRNQRATFNSWSSWNQKLSHVPHLLVNLFLVNV